MAQEIEIVAQKSMDLFYQNYKSNSDFFDLEDFVAHCGGVMGQYYNEKYEQLRAEMRQEKRDEIISFDASILLPQTLTVEEDCGELFAKLEFPVMAFPYDQNGIGIQDIFSSVPKNGISFERTTAVGKYQLKYVPTVPVVWFYSQGEKVFFINKTTTKLKKVIALTVPSVNSDKLQVPDGIVEYVVVTGAMTIKQGAQGAIVKKSSDMNQNKIIQTEADLSSIK